MFVAVNADKVLEALAVVPKGEWVTGPQLAETTGLKPEDINNTVYELRWFKYKNHCLVKVRSSILNTGGFGFQEVRIRAVGRKALECGFRMAGR